jgi:hypothetical protein
MLPKWPDVFKAKPWTSVPEGHGEARSSGIFPVAERDEREPDRASMWSMTSVQ